MSIGLAKVAISEASMKAGEAWAALNTAKEQVAAALAATQDAVGLAASAYEGTQHEYALTTVAQLNRAEAEIRLIYGKIDGDAQDALLAAQNASELFLGILG